MKTHVDTAAAVRIADTDEFACLLTTTGTDFLVKWGPMCPLTTFFEEDDEDVLMQVVRLAQPRRAEIVRVSRVIDLIDFPRRRAFTDQRLRA